MVVHTKNQNKTEPTTASNSANQVRLAKRFHFEAAHRLPNMPVGHKCRRLHGHSFTVDIICEGPPHPETGMLVDFAGIKKAFQPYYDVLDHNYLNEVEGLENPTVENLAVWIWNKLKHELPQLAVVTVHETLTSQCEYRGE